MEESNLKELFIGAAYYVNLASPDIQRLPLRAFVEKEGRQGRLQEREGFTNRVMIKAAAAVTDHQKENEMVRCHSSLWEMLMNSLWLGGTTYNIYEEGYVIRRMQFFLFVGCLQTHPDFHQSIFYLQEFIHTPHSKPEEKTHFDLKTNFISLKCFLHKWDEKFSACGLYAKRSF